MNIQTIKKLLNSKIYHILDSLDIEYETLGDNIYSNCPIHENSDNPRAFSYTIDKGIWKCWTRDCQHQYKNDILGLIQGVLSKKYNKQISFGDSLKWACKLLNVKISHNNLEQNKQEENEYDDFNRLISTIKEPETKIEHRPISIDCNIEYPSKYFLGRGFKSETLKYFNVGDCQEPESKLYNRSIIPIHNDDGSNVIGLIARSTKEYKLPKFLIHPKGFNKSDIFYNYHRAQESIIRTGCLFIVEGQGDVWRLHEADIHNAVGIFGKTISKQQEMKLHKMPLTHIIVLTDNDQAGRESKVQIYRQLNRMYKLTFPSLDSKDVGEMSVSQIKDSILPQIKGIYS